MARPLKPLPKRQGLPGSRGKEPGFRLPLIFCLALLACVALAWIFRQSVKQDPPAIDPELAEIASSWTLELTDEQGGHLEEEMASAATGLGSHAAKAAKVGELGRRALDAGRIDAAEARERMEKQLRNAREWRDVVNTFFHRFCGIDDAHGRTIYD